jgi:AraC-like DNA-binding protein
MPELFEIPENAIQAYEHMSGLRVTVHDRSRTLWQFLSPDRTIHRMAMCEAVKSGPHEPKCLTFARDQLPPLLMENPDGQIHVCHAGLVECVVPIVGDDTLKCIIFAGVRTPGRSLKSAIRYDARPLKPRPWPAKARMPAPLEEEEAEHLLEGLRMLAARLDAWLHQWERVAHSRMHASSMRDEASRSLVIRKFIQSRHTRRVTLADLAKALHLSESRAAHAVKEACGKTFVSLLNEERVRTAADLLRASELPVVEIAYRSGFGDLSHFHRTFKQQMRMTPRRYRMLAEGRS